MLDRLIEEAPRFFTYYNMLFILQGMGRTLLLTAVGCFTGFTFGFAVAALRSTTGRALLPLRFIVIIYVEIFRRIPFLVILFIVMFGIQAFARQASLFLIAMISICLLSTAFFSEIIRAGLESVPRQQREAAAVMNFGFWRTLLLVVLPQSWKVILPPAFAFMIMFIKDTALASQMGVIELAFTGKSLMSRGFSPFLVYGVVLLGYFAMSYPLTRLGAYMENRLAAPRNRQTIQRLWPGAGVARRDALPEQG
jgi:polar amino acid transport system permease protein